MRQLSCLRGLLLSSSTARSSSFWSREAKLEVLEAVVRNPDDTDIQDQALDLIANSDMYQQALGPVESLAPRFEYGSTTCLAGSLLASYRLLNHLPDLPDNTIAARHLQVRLIAKMAAQAIVNHQVLRNLNYSQIHQATDKLCDDCAPLVAFQSGIASTYIGSFIGLKSVQDSLQKFRLKLKARALSKVWP